MSIKRHNFLPTGKSTHRVTMHAPCRRIGDALSVGMLPSHNTESLTVDNRGCRVWIVPRSFYTLKLSIVELKKKNRHIEQSQRSYSYLINSLYIASKKQSRCLDYPIHLSFFNKKNIFLDIVEIFVFDAVLKATNNKSTTSQIFDHIH